MFVFIWSPWTRYLYGITGCDILNMFMYGIYSVCTCFVNAHLPLNLFLLMERIVAHICHWVSLGPWYCRTCGISRGCRPISYSLWNHNLEYIGYDFYLRGLKSDSNFYGLIYCSLNFSAVRVRVWNVPWVFWSA